MGKGIVEFYSGSYWDSKMMAYPYVVCENDKYYMFYCGNGFRVEGFGYAELDLSWEINICDGG